MTIDRLSKELDTPRTMSSSESLDADKAESYEHSPLLVQKRPKSSTPPTKRDANSNNRWTITTLTTHEECATEADILENIQSQKSSKEELNPMNLRLELKDCSSHSSPRVPRQRSRSTSLPFLMLGNLQIQPKMDTSALRVVALGEAGVGKSTLVQQFLSSVDNEWPDYDNASPEVTDQTYCKSLMVDEDKVNLEIVDTPAYGTEAFEEREDQYLSDGDAFLLVYSVTNRRSFKKANELRFKLQRSKESETVPIILVGNKTDLERSREVSFAEGKHFAALFDCKLIETSATLGLNIDELFHGVVRQVRLRKEKQLEDSETMSGGSEDSGKSSPSMRKRYSKKRRASTVLNRARGMLERIWRLRAGDEPIPGYRARSKSCHVMEIL